MSDVFKDARDVLEELYERRPFNDDDYAALHNAIIEGHRHREDAARLRARVEALAEEWGRIARQRHTDEAGVSGSTAYELCARALRAVLGGGADAGPATTSERMAPRRMQIRCYGPHCSFTWSPPDCPICHGTGWQWVDADEPAERKP